MKNLIFTLIFVATTLFASAQQVEREYVLMEVGTATWCGPCNSAANAMSQLDANNFPVIYVKYQLSDGQWTVPSSNVRANYYGISGIPHAIFDGVGNVVGANYNSYVNWINNRLAIPTSFVLNIFGTYEDGAGNMIVKVDQVGPNTDNLKVYISITETVNHSWQGQTQLKYMNRNMLPNGFGTVIDINEGESVQVEHDFTIQANWLDENIQITAWVQNDATKEVHVVNKVALLDLESMDILQADFFAEINEACPNTPIVFTNTSTGGDSYLWEFPGGIPAESTEENPEVYYEEAGSYDVTLTVFNGDASNTLTMADYITIMDLPEVAFEVVPVMCEFWDPYELTQGYPEGGAYSGEGVVDGYFHPQDVGVGFYEVTYSYTNENDCTVEVMQVLEVDACTGVEENQHAVAKVFPNPTNGKLTIDFNANLISQASVRVYNSLGHLVFEQKSIALSANRQQEIDLGGQAEGIYLIHIQQGETSQYQRIVLKY
jgi:PKD repeat protein